MSHKHPPSTGEERAASERQSIYHDPNLRRQKRAESRELDARYNSLCGEVTVTRTRMPTLEEKVEKIRIDQDHGRPASSVDRKILLDYIDQLLDYDGVHYQGA